jgi:hypothetical protein
MVAKNEWACTDRMSDYARVFTNIICLRKMMGPVLQEIGDYVPIE